MQYGAYLGYIYIHTHILSVCGMCMFAYMYVPHMCVGRSSVPIAFLATLPPPYFSSLPEPEAHASGSAASKLQGSTDLHLLSPGLQISAAGLLVQSRELKPGLHACMEASTLPAEPLLQRPSPQIYIYIIITRGPAIA